MPPLSTWGTVFSFRHAQREPPKRQKPYFRSIPSAKPHIQPAEPTQISRQSLCKSSCIVAKTMRNAAPRKRTDSSVVERLLYTQLVGGSNPSPCTIFGHKNFTPEDCQTKYAAKNKFSGHSEVRGRGVWLPGRGTPAQGAVRRRAFGGLGWLRLW